MDCPECGPFIDPSTPFRPVDPTPSAYDGMSDRELLIAVLVELKSVRVEHAETVAKVNGLLEGMAPHLEQVGPMIDALANNPMFRMLAGGGGKKKS
jgi:hypothetical protein